MCSVKEKARLHEIVHAMREINIKDGETPSLFNSGRDRTNPYPKFIFEYVLSTKDLLAIAKLRNITEEYGGMGLTFRARHDVVRALPLKLLRRMTTVVVPKGFDGYAICYSIASNMSEKGMDRAKDKDLIEALNRAILIPKELQCYKVAI